MNSFTSPHVVGTALAGASDVTGAVVEVDATVVSVGAGIDDVSLTTSEPFEPHAPTRIAAATTNPSAAEKPFVLTFTLHLLEPGEKLLLSDLTLGEMIGMV